MGVRTVILHWAQQLQPGRLLRPPPDRRRVRIRNTNIDVCKSSCRTLQYIQPMPCPGQRGGQKSFCLRTFPSRTSNNRALNIFYCLLSFAFQAFCARNPLRSCRCDWQMLIQTSIGCDHFCLPRDGNPAPDLAEGNPFRTNFTCLRTGRHVEDFYCTNDPHRNVLSPPPKLLKYSYS